MTSSKSRGLIPAGSIGDDLVAWEAPEMARPSAENSADPEAELAALREQVLAQAQAEGHAAGLAAAKAEIDALRDALSTTMRALSRPLEELDHAVEDELLALVQAVARQLVRRELRADPGEVVGVIRAALEALPVTSRDVVVRLHPEDARRVREMLNPESDEMPWTIQADPVLERGSCQVVTATSQVDGRLETRLGRVIATMFEEQRDQD